MSSTLKPMTLWMTGRPCSGKSSLALRLKSPLESLGFKVVSLDGDAFRGRLSADLGFSPQDRRENLRRAAHVAQLFNENGSFVIASFVTPTHEVQKLVRSVVERFKLCFIQCSPEVCEKRDVKGMYKKARRGEIPDFTGVQAPFEDPSDASITVDTENQTEEQCTRHILQAIQAGS